MNAVVRLILLLGFLATTYVTAAPGTPVTILVPEDEFAVFPTSAPAEIQGVDAQGRTTYAFLDEGKGSESPLTATFVAATDHFIVPTSQVFRSRTFKNGVDCDLRGGVAICSDSGLSVTISGALLRSIVLDVTATDPQSSSTAVPSSTPIAPPSSGSSGEPSTTSTGAATSKRGNTAFVVGSLVGLFTAMYQLL
ncbi:hypothetical protein C8R43DRAFT_966706 [Mycena crocata]|nr:hypothetical protein C8R43DRAFT_966706 [Mycena crocata]